MRRAGTLTGQLAAVHLSDAHYITDASKFISVVLLALRAMMQLEMPHVNVLSKIDLLSTYGKLRASFPLCWFASRSIRLMVDGCIKSTRTS